MGLAKVALGIWLIGWISGGMAKPGMKSIRIEKQPRKAKEKQVRPVKEKEGLRYDVREDSLKYVSVRMVHRLGKDNSVVLTDAQFLPQPWNNISWEDATKILRGDSLFTLADLINLVEQSGGRLILGHYAPGRDSLPQLLVSDSSLYGPISMIGAIPNPLILDTLTLEEVLRFSDLVVSINHVAFPEPDTSQYNDLSVVLQMRIPYETWRGIDSIIVADHNVLVNEGVVIPDPRLKYDPASKELILPQKNEIELFDVNGRRIRSFSTNKLSLEESLRLLPSGNYFLSTPYGGARIVSVNGRVVGVSIEPKTSNNNPVLLSKEFFHSSTQGEKDGSQEAKIIYSPELNALIIVPPNDFWNYTIIHYTSDPPDPVRDRDIIFPGTPINGAYTITFQLGEPPEGLTIPVIEGPIRRVLDPSMGIVRLVTNVHDTLWSQVRCYAAVGGNEFMGYLNAYPYLIAGTPEYNAVLSDTLFSAHELAHRGIKGLQYYVFNIDEKIILSGRRWLIDATSLFFPAVIDETLTSFPVLWRKYYGGPIFVPVGLMAASGLTSLIDMLTFDDLANPGNDSTGPDYLWNISTNPPDTLIIAVNDPVYGWGFQQECEFDNKMLLLIDYWRAWAPHLEIITIDGDTTGQGFFNPDRDGVWWLVVNDGSWNGEGIFFPWIVGNPPYQKYLGGIAYAPHNGAIAKEVLQRFIGSTSGGTAEGGIGLAGSSAGHYYYEPFRLILFNPAGMQSYWMLSPQLARVFNEFEIPWNSAGRNSLYNGVFSSGPFPAQRGARNYWYILYGWTKNHRWDYNHYPPRNGLPLTKKLSQRRINEVLHTPITSSLYQPKQ